METERWQQIESIFQLALDCAPDSRGALLDSACGGDAELRREVDSLLHAYDCSGSTEPRAFQEGVAALEHRAGQLMAGRRVGPYSIIRVLGRGGMGTVYLGARADEAFQKLVAIKVLGRGLDTDELIHRFRTERQILANLDHPHIARLLDGGATEDGLPYFVMEYIDGEPIDQFCDAHKLNLTERLKLFQSVCAAVHYAHQNLVVHRDIKPGNVLVTKEGVPRLLDFGIAKMLMPGASSPEATVTVLRALTPEFASPEQMRGEPITTASDVYSLGVLLYLLLTGCRPYRLASSTAAEFEAAICHQEPISPSVAVMQRDSALRRRLEGDLDNIVLMALRKEPQRRYASVEQFSQDISRHLDSLPVIARPDTRRYRAAKFMQRHKAGVAATAAIFLVLLAGIAATLRQTHIARQQRDRARLEQAKADRIKTFLTDMLTYSSPEYSSSNPAKDRDAKVSEVVDQAARRAAEELADQPEVLADVQSTIGGVYVAQGRYDEAEAILHFARERSIQLYGPDSHNTAEVSGMLANAMLGKGKYAEADALFRQDIDIERRLAAQGRGNPKNLAYVLGGYGAMLDQRNDRGAEPYLREALNYSSAFTGKERVFVAMLYNNLSNEAGYRGDVDESERCLRASLEEYRKLPPGTYVEMATTLSNLGALLIGKGKYAEAEPFVLQGLELRRKVLGNAHPGTAAALFRLSDLLFHQGRYGEAANAAQESIDVFRRALPVPENSTLFTNPVLEMGMILQKAGRTREAEPYLRQALAIRTRLLPKGNRQIGSAEGALGECLTVENRFAEAEPLLLDSYTIIETTTPPRDGRRKEAAQRLKDLYSKWGKPQESARYLALSGADGQK